MVGVQNREGEEDDSLWVGEEQKNRAATTKNTSKKGEFELLHSLVRHWNNMTVAILTGGGPAGDGGGGPEPEGGGGGRFPLGGGGAEEPGGYNKEHKQKR